MDILASKFNIVYLLDIVALLWLIIDAFKGAKKGFVACVFGVLSTVIALILAFSLAPVTVRALSSLFGENGSVTHRFEGVLSGWTGFNADISGEGLAAALDQISLPSFLKNLLLKNASSINDLPAGTTLAKAVAPIISQFLGLILSGTVLFIAAKILLFFLEKILTRLVRSVSAVSAVNTLFGCIAGFLKAALIICGILELLALIPSASVTEFFNKTFLLKYLYHENPLAKLWSIFIKF